jgi:type IV secretory pathway VirB2 component (pilin)
MLVNKIMNRNTLLQATGSFLYLLGSSACWANADSPINKGVSVYIADALLSGTGITIATLTMMGTGLACLFHKMEWAFFGYTLAIIGVIYTIAPIIRFFAGL